MWLVRVYAHYIVVWTYIGGNAQPSQWGLRTLWSRSCPRPNMLERESANKGPLPKKRAERSNKKVIEY